MITHQRVCFTDLKISCDTNSFEIRNGWFFSHCFWEQDIFRIRWNFRINLENDTALNLHVVGNPMVFRHYLPLWLRSRYSDTNNHTYFLHSEENAQNIRNFHSNRVWSIPILHGPSKYVHNRVLTFYSHAWSRCSWRKNAMQSQKRISTV